MKTKITVGVGVGVFNDLTKLPNVETDVHIIQFVNGVDDRIVNSAPLFKNDLNIHNSAFKPKLIESELYPNYIEVEWVGKFIQQQRIKKAESRIPNLLLSIPTWDIHSDWQSSLIGMEHKVVIKPSGGAKGESINVYDSHDPKLVRMMDIFNRSEEFDKEFPDSNHPSDSYMVQMLMPKEAEWRIINLGDNLIIADRDATADVSNTLTLDNPYRHHMDYVLPRHLRISKSYFVDTIKRIIKEVGIPFGSSIDLILAEGTDKFSVIEYQPQFGDRNMNPDVKSLIAKALVDYYIKPKLKDN